MSPSLGRWGARMLVLLLAGVALGWLASTVDRGSMQGLWDRVPMWGWGLAVLAQALSHMMRAGRLHAELRRVRPVRFGACLRLSLVHVMAINLLPLRSGEATYPVVLHRRFHVPLPSAVGSLIWMRVQDGVVLLGLAWTAWGPGPFGWRVAALCAAVMLVAAMWPWARERLPAPWVARWAAPQRHVSSTWFYTLGNWSLKLSGAALLLGFMVGATGADAAVAALAGELSALLPIQAPAGLGTYEVAVAWGLRPAAAAWPQAVSAALFVHLFTVLGTCIGACTAWILDPSLQLLVHDTSTAHSG